MSGPTTTMPPPPSPSPCEKVLTMTIGSYSDAKKLANGRFVKSSPADVGGHSWRIAFYPNGNLAGTTKSMSLFLLLDDDDAKGHGQGSTAAASGGEEEDFRVKYKFMMRDVADGTLTFMSGEITAAFNRRRRYSHGFERFVSRADFEKSPLFRSDRFAIRCDLTVFPAGTQAPLSKPSAARAAPPPPSSSSEPSVVRKNTPAPATAAPPKQPSVPRAAPPPSSSPKPSAVKTRTPPPPPPVPPEPAMAPPPSGLHVDFGRLLATKEGADVELEVCGKVFAAHKSVLAARSSVLREEFFGPTKEKNTSYILIGMHRPEAFEALLHYMYTDSLPEMTTMTNSLEQGAVVAEDLLVAAESYNMKDLKSLVESKLCSHVGVSTVLLMLALAERYQCCKLKKTCLRFIGSSANTKAVMATTNGVENLARSSPSVVKDVLTEIILDASAREARVVNGCIWVICFLLLLLIVFS